MTINHQFGNAAGIHSSVGSDFGRPGRWHPVSGVRTAVRGR